jgi:hypothetical protein
MKRYADLLPVNQQEGLLVDNLEEPMTVFGAYSHHNKTYVIQVDYDINGISLPDSLSGYKFKGRVGHIGLTHWDSATNTDVTI